MLVRERPTGLVTAPALRGLPDFALIAAKARAWVRRRAYWQVRYWDGKVVSEWERDWSHLRRRGLMQGRLVCPNGKVGYLGMSSGADISERVFQFKVAMACAGPPLPISRVTTAQVMGIVYGLDGESVVYVWEPEPGQLIGPFEDNVFSMAYQNVGRLAFEHVGIKPD